jgi:hypothetical protein
VVNSGPAVAVISRDQVDLVEAAVRSSSIRPNEKQKGEPAWLPFSIYSCDLLLRLRTHA